ncbi:hypothetical protein GCM10020358_21580 [Amorphoplanes nipponensis]
MLITGCSSGVGLATAVRAAQAGHTTVATLRDEDRAGPLRQAAAAAGVKLEVRRLDVTDEASIDACLTGVLEAHGRLDALVNNAGQANTFACVETAGTARFRAGLEVNLFGVVAATRAALPHLRASRGRVVTVGSTRGLIGQPFNEAYSAAKFAVEGFLESLAPVAASQGVRVVLVEPGPVLGTAFGANSGVTRESLLAEAGPYAEVLADYLDWVARGGHPGAQSAAEVAEVLLRALTDDAPPFRIMTSAWGERYARTKLADPGGAAVTAMTRSWLAPRTLLLHPGVVRRSIELVTAIREDQWERPTPCAEWTVADLVTHMIRENRGFAAAARGERTVPADWHAPVGVDLRAEYAASARAVIAAFGADGALSRTLWLPLIRDGICLPARQALGFHLLDYLVHGWDVAAATGQPAAYDDDVVAAVREIAERDVPDGPRRHRPQATFAPARPLPDGAPPLHRLLGFLGRDPGWGPR